MKKIDEIRLMLKNGLEPDYQGWGWEYVKNVCRANEILEKFPLCNKNGMIYCLDYELKKDYSEKNKAIVIVGVIISNEFCNHEIFIIDTLDFENFNVQRCPLILDELQKTDKQPATVIQQPATVIQQPIPIYEYFNAVVNHFRILSLVFGLLSMAFFGLFICQLLH